MSMMDVEVEETRRAGSDGTTFAADIFRPSKPGKYPVILMRTPYDRRRSQANNYASPYWFASQGFLAVVEDVRGRGASGGEFVPFAAEEQDGYESVEWAANIPYSNGKVGMYGLSYPGVTQMQAAAAVPPSLSSIAPAMTSSEYYEGWTYRGGALELAFALSWAVMLAHDAALRAGDVSAFRVLTQAYANASACYAELPLSKAEPLASLGYAPYFFDWLAHPANDSYWRRWALQERYSKIKAAGLHIGGWWDIFLAGTLENFAGLTSTPGCQAQKCIVGPWTHAIDESQLHSALGIVANPLDEWHLNWFNHTLRDAADPWPQAVNLYILREKRWLRLPTWPAPEARTEEWFLTSTGRANSDRGNGALQLEMPGSGPPDVYTYDPLDPVPSIGGASCCSATVSPMGPADQAAVEASNDVLVYTSPPFQKDCLLTGQPVARLYVTSTAADTDFVARLCIVDREGRSVNVSDGIQRGTAMRQPGAPALGPDAPCQFMIRLQPVTVGLRAGERIRLQVTSSAFPRWDRNFNTLKPPAECDPTDAVVARQLVLHDQAHPSSLSISFLDD